SQSWFSRSRAPERDAVPARIHPTGDHSDLDSVRSGLCRRELQDGEVFAGAVDRDVAAGGGAQEEMEAGTILIADSHEVVGLPGIQLDGKCLRLLHVQRAHVQNTRPAGRRPLYRPQGPIELRVNLAFPALTLR